ncbi:hypothetical protein GCM10017771_96930 [Streptomyces capitiformicae]|uniref:Uncharacterized protein n=1 Tax=Streptomyces capitiformicae TaxID=2014920 RepID=A0A918ZVN6_9ACTN|nr:hypothetical protein GCM10017771_96930 [Streptomyces capitiformicae]
MPMPPAVNLWTVRDELAAAAPGTLRIVELQTCVGDVFDTLAESAVTSARTPRHARTAGHTPTRSRTRPTPASRPDTPPPRRPLARSPAFRRPTPQPRRRKDGQDPCPNRSRTPQHSPWPISAGGIPRCP